MISGPRKLVLLAAIGGILSVGAIVLPEGAAAQQPPATATPRPQRPTSTPTPAGARGANPTGRGQRRHGSTGQTRRRGARRSGTGARR